MLDVLAKQLSQLFVRVNLIVNTAFKLLKGVARIQRHFVGVGAAETFCKLEIGVEQPRVPQFNVDHSAVTRSSLLGLVAVLTERRVDVRIEVVNQRLRTVPLF